MYAFGLLVRLTSFNFSTVLNKPPHDIEFPGIKNLFRVDIFVATLRCLTKKINLK